MKILQGPPSICGQWKHLTTSTDFNRLRAVNAFRKVMYHFMPKEGTEIVTMCIECNRSVVAAQRA
ncbi:unnamed protein product [Ceratitis capitata]|uniref:(Mediterranean fruit fly) hypothetical protein n=1 Tax=Ceratitis capitata TaxID=7213 RepID=A0A811ULJ3_CERCA|nr:unnamed protein product [Ceratitis capitata]